MEFKEFRIGDLFEQERGKEKAPNQAEPGDCQLVNETSTNNGWTKLVKPTKRFAGNAITISINFANTVFYQPKEFCASVNIAILRNKWLNYKRALYIVTLLKKQFVIYDYNNKISKDKINDTKISLPVTPSGEIDFDYMEQYIEKIEKQYIEKIALMLKASGLDNYQLTEEEKAVLKEEKEKKEFKIEELFEYKTGDVDLQKTDLTETGEWVVTAGTTNYGLLGKTTKIAKIISKNTITIDMFGCAFYRNFDYKMVTHARVFALIPKIKCSEHVGLFLTGSLAYLKKLFSYQNMCSFSKIKDLTIQLPITSSGEIDFDYMEKYISAIIKTKIKNVVLEINKKLELYKQTQN